MAVKDQKKKEMLEYLRSQLFEVIIPAGSLKYCDIAGLCGDILGYFASRDMLSEKEIERVFVKFNEKFEKSYKNTF